MNTRHPNLQSQEIVQPNQERCVLSRLNPMKNIFQMIKLTNMTFFMTEYAFKLNFLKLQTRQQNLFYCYYLPANLDYFSRILKLSFTFPFLITYHVLFKFFNF